MVEALVAMRADKEAKDEVSGDEGGQMGVYVLCMEGICITNVQFGV